MHLLIWIAAPFTGMDKKTTARIACTGARSDFNIPRGSPREPRAAVPPCGCRLLCLSLENPLACSRRGVPHSFWLTSSVNVTGYFLPMCLFKLHYLPEVHPIPAPMCAPFQCRLPGAEPGACSGNATNADPGSTRPRPHQQRPGRSDDARSIGQNAPPLADTAEYRLVGVPVPANGPPTVPTKGPRDWPSLGDTPAHYNNAPTWDLPFWPQGRRKPHDYADF
jgi:hypothetical protein